jgi:hypothetical protein
VKRIRQSCRNRGSYSNQFDAYKLLVDGPREGLQATFVREKKLFTFERRYYLGSNKTMSLSENVCPPLAARAATDPSAARLLEMFAKADELLSERSVERIGDVEIPKLALVPLGLLS